MRKRKKNYFEVFGIAVTAVLPMFIMQHLISSDITHLISFHAGVWAMFVCWFSGLLNEGENND